MGKRSDMPAHCAHSNSSSSSSNGLHLNESRCEQQAGMLSEPADSEEVLDDEEEEGLMGNATLPAARRGLGKGQRNESGGGRE
jgi:hypothetical protein